MDTHVLIFIFQIARMEMLRKLVDTRKVMFFGCITVPYHSQIDIIFKSFILGMGLVPCRYFMNVQNHEEARSVFVC